MSAGVQEHHHRPRASAEAPYVDEGPTVGPAEALVLMEIDLTAAGAPRSHHMHTMIRRRRAVDREFIAGVYPELLEGAYTVWGIDGHPLGEVTIRGGHVGEFHSGGCGASGNR
jgi:hypothetical protein